MSDTASPRPQHQVRWRIKFVAAALYILMLVVLLEGGSRLVYWIWTTYGSTLVASKKLSSMLDEYEMEDPARKGNWVLRPNTSFTTEQLAEEKRKRGASIGPQRTNTITSQYRIPQDTVVLRINRQGYKGPEIDEGHTKTRILTLGDSCTFGSFVDKYSYPRVLEQTLQGGGRSIEVINGGVESYSVQNILWRLPELVALRPEIVTLYIGWNNIYSRRIANQHPLHFIRLLKIAANNIFPSPHQSVTFYDASAPSLLDDGLPGIFFLDDLKTIVDTFKASGSKVVLITLPGLFVSDETPSAKALKMGHMPEYTNNALILAKLTEHYNNSLRYKAREWGVGLVDLDAWSRNALSPRDSYFFDSVHMEEKGQIMVGQFLAEKLVEMLPDH